MNAKNKVVATNVIWAFVVKGLSLGISFCTVPAFISYFHNNIYLGVWYTILSILSWFLTFDFGIGNGLRNNLVKAVANNDSNRIKSILSSGLFSAVIVSLLMIVVGVTILRLIDLHSLFNITDNQIRASVLYKSSVYVLIAIALRFMLSYVSSIFYALQKAYVNNILAFISSSIILVFVKFSHFSNTEDALLYLSFAFIFLTNLPTIIAGIILFISNLKEYRPSVEFIHKNALKDILKVGGVFFYCQILYTLITCTDQFFITKFYGATYTVDYTFYYRLTSLVGLIVALAITPIWSMVTKADEEKDYVWLSSLFLRLKRIGYLIVLLEFLMIPVLQPLMNLWLGDASIEVNYLTAFAFACFGGSFVFASIMSSIVCGLSTMKLQSTCYTIGVILKFGIILILAKYYQNWNLVVWTNVIVFTPYTILEIIHINRLIKNKLDTALSK